MKKTIFAFVASVLALSACSSDDLLDNKNQPTDTMTFTATIGDEDGETSRTYTYNTYVKWSKGDEISVFSGAALTTNNKMTLTRGDGTTSASFSGNCAKATQYFAIYPYNTEHSAKDYNNLGCKIVWNCAEQIAVKGSFDTSVPMIAMASNVSETATSVPLQFKNIYSFVKVTTDYKCKSITLTSHDGSIASIFRYISFDNDGNPNPTYESTTQSDVITLKGKDGAIIEAGTYYIAVHPTTLSKGFDITFTSVYDDTKKYTKSTSKSVTFTRNKVLNLGDITLRGTDVETLEGTGTTENPYKINDMEDLITFQRWITSEKGETWKKSYLQTADIDFHGEGMNPIGTAIHRFWGTYDGGGHSIKNMLYTGTIECASARYLDKNKVSALFGAIRSATIRNLTIENPTFSTGVTGSYQVYSPLVGVAYCGDADFDNSRCKIENCKLTGTCGVYVTTINDKKRETNWMTFCYGGFVGDSQSHLEINDCSTDMDLTIYHSCKYLSDNENKYSTIAVGGFVGAAQGVRVKDSDNDLSHDAYVRINRCRNNSSKMTVNETSQIKRVAVGGFIGQPYDMDFDDDVACKIYNSVNNAFIEVVCSYSEKTGGDIGGFIGANYSDGYGSVDPCCRNCVNNGNLKSNILCSMGGIIGWNDDNDTHMMSCANTGTLTKSNSDSSTPYAMAGYQGTLTECWNCTTVDYPLCGDPGDVTNSGKKTTIDDVVTHMNGIDLVKKDSYFYNWKKSTFNGRVILDLEY